MHKSKLNWTLRAGYSPGSISGIGKVNSLPIHIHLCVDFKLSGLISLLPWQSSNDSYGPYLYLMVPIISIAKSSHQWEAWVKSQWRNIIWVKTICNLISKDLYFISNAEHWWVRTLRIRQREMTLFQNKEVKNSSTSVSVYSTPSFLFLSTSQAGTLTGITSTQVSLAFLKPWQHYYMWMQHFSINGQTTLFPLLVILNPQKTSLLTDRCFFPLPPPLTTALGLEACTSWGLIFLIFSFTQLKSSPMEGQLYARED